MAGNDTLLSEMDSPFVEISEPGLPRPHCYRCDKPEATCLCAEIVRIENRTPIVILQHKRESRHPLGTVRIANLGLTRCRIEVVSGGISSGTTPPAWLPEGIGLVYPGTGSRELVAEARATSPRSLLFLDGTWHQARALFRDHAWLRELPRYRLTPTQPSRYRIRREPLPQYVSTIEAIVQALEILEPELSGARGLLTAFESLIDRQIQQTQRSSRAPRRRERRPASFRKLPRALVEGFEQLVVVYGEAARPAHDAEARTELVHWTALRLRDGKTFDCVIRPEPGMPSAARLDHLGLPAHDVASGVCLTELRDRWLDFLDPSDLLAAWNPRTLALFEQSVDVSTPGVGLKGVYRRLRGVDGDLDRVLDSEATPPLPFELRASMQKIRGRARARLDNAIRVVFLLRRLAFESAEVTAD